MSSEHCQSTVELSMLAAGMAKQHERYQDALQELVDNAVSSVVTDETYFDNPEDKVELVLTVVRGEDTVKTFIADNGPGITKTDLQNHVFRTGNKEKSEGILNNVGWGLKASIAWFERTLKQHNLEEGKRWFSLVTQTESGPIHRVDGPITGNLPIHGGSSDDWERGIQDGDHSLTDKDHGTRLHVSCSREQFDSDVWPSADSLSKKVQVLRERFGVLFRRLLEARDDNSIIINYHDLEAGEGGSVNVVPISPVYEYNDTDDEEYGYHEFTIEDGSGRAFKIEYEHGTLDFDAMTDAVTDDHPELLTTSGRFRYRYRPSQKHQGVDIYANGRVLMTSVFSDLFDLTRNNQYNYFGGTLRIIPVDHRHDVPTDNKKTRIDTNSVLWQEIQERLAEPECQPAGKDYRGTALGNTRARENNGSEEEPETSTESSPSEEDSISISDTDELFSLHNKDAKSLKSVISAGMEQNESSEIVDVAITSPPYFDLKDYGYEGDDQIGQQESYEAYLDSLREVFGQVYDVMNSSGTLWVVVNSFRRNHQLVQLPADIARACQTLDDTIYCPNCSGSNIDVPLERDWLTDSVNCPNCDFSGGASNSSWILQDVVIWNKQRARPFADHGEFRNIYEYVLCFSKTPEFTYEIDDIRISDPVDFEKWWVGYPDRYHPRGMLPDNIWEFKSPDRGAFGNKDITHPAPLPPGLAERIIQLTSNEGDVVLDPFAGSGTVLAQATAMDRDAIGFELSESFCEGYETVKEQIHQEWENENRSTQGNQKPLSQMLCSLRHIKHTREHLREMAQRINVAVPTALDIHTVFHVVQSADYQAVDEETHGRGDVIYVTDDGTTKREMAEYQRVAEESLSDRPCSGFGLDITPIVLTTDEFLSEIAQEGYTQLPEQLYLYEDGRHYAYAQQLQLGEWVEYISSTSGWHEAFDNHNCPPILSNLSLDVNHPIYDLETMPRQQSEEHNATLYRSDGTVEFDIEIVDRR